MMKERDIPSCGKDIVELLLQCGRILKWPVGFVLVNEYNIFENGLGNAHERGNFSVHVSATIAEANFFATVRVNGLKDTLDGLVFHFGGLLRELKGPYANDIFTGGGFESELNLSLGFGFTSDLGVVNEAVARPRVGRQLAGAGKLQAFYDCLHKQSVREEGNDRVEK